MRTRTFAVLAVALSLLSVTAQDGAAQTGFGVYAGYDWESEEGLLGLNLHFPITVGQVPRTTISPQFEVLTNTDILVVNAGASVRFHPWWRADAQVSPYFGPGLLLGYNDFSEETEVGIQAIAGLEFALDRIRPFTHLEVAFGGFDVTALVAGLQFNF